MKKDNKFNLLFVIGTIAVAIPCYAGYVYYEKHPSIPKVFTYIWGIIASIDAFCLMLAVEIVWKAICDGIKAAFLALKPEWLKKKQEEKVRHNWNEKRAAVSHVNGLMNTESSNKNKLEIIKEIIDRIGFSEFETNMLLLNSYTAEFTIPENEQTKKRYLKDWVELLAVNGKLSNQEYRLCCDMATKYECSEDIIKEIMDDMGISVISTMKPTDWLKELETIIYDYCERVYHSKPDFRIKLYTNFKNNLNFDGIDIAEISMAVEKKFSVRIPEDHPFNNRLADDTDFTVEDLLVAFGLIEATEITKKEGRYYFYDDRCSFNLAKEDIKQDDVEKGGLKHTLFTESMFMLVIEIRPGMPQFPSNIPIKMTKAGCFECLAAKVSPLSTDYHQYFINCGKFVVQVSFSIVSDINKVNSFLNSFRLEK